MKDYSVNRIERQNLNRITEPSLLRFAAAIRAFAARLPAGKSPPRVDVQRQLEPSLLDTADGPFTGSANVCRSFKQKAATTDTRM
jgi:hypothetical protein